MIEVKGLTKHFGRIEAVHDVSFRVEQGEIVGFLGPNGAGKTTTMRILTGFIPATRGTAVLAGFDVHKKPLEVKRLVGYLPENVPLYPEMLVKSYLQYVAEIKGLSRSSGKDEVGRVIERCGVESIADRTIRHISKGYRQRVGLAQALIALSHNETQASLWPQLKNWAAQNRSQEVIFEFSHSLGQKQWDGLLLTLRHRCARREELLTVTGKEGVHHEA